MQYHSTALMLETCTHGLEPVLPSAGFFGTPTPKQSESTSIYKLGKIKVTLILTPKGRSHVSRKSHDSIKIKSYISASMKLVHSSSVAAPQLWLFDSYSK